MTYNFNFAISATINAKTVEDMVKKVVEDQTGRRVKKITFKTRTVSSGYGRDEYDHREFDGCSVEFATDNTPAHEDFSDGGYR